MKSFRSKFLRGDSLALLKRSRFFRWLFFLSATIGAVVVILKVPVTIFDFFAQELNVKKYEYEKISALKLDVTLDYIVDVFGAPTYELDCDSDLHSPCFLSSYSTVKYTFDEGDYYIQVLTDKNDSIISYSIFSKSSDFNPQIELFLGRFEGYRTLTLGGSTFSDFDVIEGNNGFMEAIDYPLLGNNFGGFLQEVFSDDYAVDSILIFESSDWADYSRLDNDFSCNYSLLETYQLDEMSIEENKQIFKETCPIQSLTVITTYLPEMWEMDSESYDQLLKDQLQFFSID